MHSILVGIPAVSNDLSAAQTAYDLFKLEL